MKEAAYLVITNMINVLTNPASSPSQAVIDAVASREGVEPVNLEPPLYDAIDPDALDALVKLTAPGPEQAPIAIEFPYHGYEVHVCSAGGVTVSIKG